MTKDLSSTNKKLFVAYLALVFIGFATFKTIKAYSDSQDKFSGDIQKFPTELNNVLKQDVSKENEQLLKDFTKFWTVDSILNDEQKTRIVNASTTMLGKTLNSKNHFFTYVNLVMFFWKDEYAKKHYETWEKGFIKIVEDSKNSINVISDFLKVSLSTITKNIINERGGYFWKVSKPSYQFDTAKEFAIRFDSVNLICSNLKDSIYIKSTQGTYYPLTKRWLGKGGKVTWVRSGYPEDAIFAKLQKYRINLNENNYRIDSVYFTNKDYFTKPTLGELTDWLIKDYRPESIPYPEFQSYDQWFQIKDLFQNVDYEGGFTMRGSKLIGTGGKTKLATITIKRNDKEFLRVEGNILIFQRQIINSEKARIRFKFDNDSIFHTGLNFNYNDQNKTVVITPTDKLLTQSPFNTSYHKLSITADQLKWIITDDKIQFGGFSAFSRATFESDNFFNEERFDMMMGPNEKHPLLALASYAKKVKSKFFLAMDFASYIRKSIEQVRIEMMKIAMQGYIFYDFNADEIQLTPKLYNAVKARSALIDYDVINFASQTDGYTPNAELSLNTMDLLINGVESIYVSDSQNVNFFPTKRQIVMQKNRNFTFGGSVRAGLFLFQGKKFQFDYENFKIALEDVDSLKIDYKTTQIKSKGSVGLMFKTIQSTLEKVSGDILIDKPDNKSGLKKNVGYPIFNSTIASFIYYDDHSIFRGVYKRDSFYFKVNPYVFKNLNSFEQSSIKFVGTLYSSNIIAPIEDTLRLRPDNSLGIINRTPPDGYAIYEGKGKIFNTIDLSNRGLMARGRVKYITSTTTSDNIYLFPDSLITESTNFTIDQQLAGIQYPETKGDEHSIKWHPKREKFYAFKGKQPFNMYTNQARLSGDILLEPLGLTGNGSIRLDNAKLTSNKYEFNANDFVTDSTSLDLYVPASDSLAFETTRLKAKINFLNRMGTFAKNDISIYAKMQPLKYDVHLDSFIWNLDNNNLTMSTSGRQKAVETEKFYVSRMADKDSIPIGSVFYSTKFNEDSLYFFSPKATYNLKNLLLNADSVKYLLVADAAIYPENKKISIEPARRLLPLSNATIAASIPKRYHQIYNADITIVSRKKYFGKGCYNYIDERDSIEVIALNELAVNDKNITYGNGNIAPTDSFKLSPEFGFIGKVTLNAPDKFLHFNGGARPIYRCSKLNPNLVKFESTINPDSILIPVSDAPQNIYLAKLINGSIITEDSINLYGSLLGIRKTYSDIPFVLASGYMNFNKNNRRFTIGPSYKIFNPDTSGNTISLQKDFCMLFGEGKIVLPIDLGQVKLKINGNTIHKLEDKSLTIDAILQINFFFNPKSLEAMATDLNSFPLLDKVDLNRKIIKKTLYELTEPKEAASALSQISLFGAPTQIPKGFESTITLADVKLKWNQRTRSFISYGKIGIGTIGNMQVNKRVNGYIEIVKRRSGDFMTLYLHLGEDKYYVFTYTKGAMQVSSNNLAFVDPIKQMKARDRKVKVPLGQQKYNFLIGTRNELSIARQRYSQLQEGDDSNDDTLNEDKSSKDSETKESTENESKELKK